jgi:hypothetical protein
MVPSPLSSMSSSKAMDETGAADAAMTAGAREMGVEAHVVIMKCADDDDGRGRVVVYTRVIRL